jgi:hypothetical protein
VGLFVYSFSLEFQSKNNILMLDEKSPWKLQNDSATLGQGCQIFLGPKYQNGVKYTTLPQNVPNGNEIFPMALK